MYGICSYLISVTVIIVMVKSEDGLLLPGASKVNSQLIESLRRQLTAGYDEYDFRLAPRPSRHHRLPPPVPGAPALTDTSSTDYDDSYAVLMAKLGYNRSNLEPKPTPYQKETAKGSISAAPPNNVQLIEPYRESSQVINNIVPEISSRAMTGSAAEMGKTQVDNMTVVVLRRDDERTVINQPKEVVIVPNFYPLEPRFKSERRMLEQTAREKVVEERGSIAEIGVMVDVKGPDVVADRKQNAATTESNWKNLAANRRRVVPERKSAMGEMKGTVINIRGPDVIGDWNKTGRSVADWKSIMAERRKVMAEQRGMMQGKTSIVDKGEVSSEKRETMPFLRWSVAGKRVTMPDWIWTMADRGVPVADKRGVMTVANEGAGQR